MTAGVPVTAARWMLLGEWRAHPARVVTAALAIAIGVALGFAVHLVNASALDSFERALSSVNGAADMQVRAANPAERAGRILVGAGVQRSDALDVIGRRIIGGRRGRGH